MSTPDSPKPESELGLDLDLHFLPSWAQKSTDYSKFTGEDDRGGRRDRGPRPPGRGPRREGPGGGGPRREGGGGPRRDFGGPQQARGPRPEGGQPGGERRERGPQGGGRFQGGGQRGNFRGRGGPREGQQERREIPLPDLEVSFIPEERGVESLARQIKLTGRAYPLFDIAHLVLKKPERYHVELKSIKKPEGQPQQMIYICDLDQTIWLSEKEAMDHTLAKHFSTFYSEEKIPTDPPKGTYTFVAQCGVSGAILGPPNYHDYQNKLRKLHADRFSRMPFDLYKSRIKIVKDEAVVKKWLEEQSFRTEYTALNIPDTLKFNSREEVENHFKQTHLPVVIKAVDSFTVSGVEAQKVQNRQIQALIRRAYDDQMRFPLKVVTNLSQQFARQGLQFFKVNKTVTHVAVARPRYLDLETTPVSEGVRKIVDFINATPKCTRRKLIEALAPAAEHAPAPAPEQAPAPPQPEQQAEGAPAAAEAQPAAAPAQPPEPPEVASIVSDLHWLVHEGHVIEFANGILETAKKPAPKPPPREKKQKPAAEASPGQETPAEANPLDASTDHTSEQVAQPGSSEAEAAQPASSPEAQPEATTAVEPSPELEQPKEAPPTEAPSA